MEVCQNSFFEEITPAAVICSRGEPFYLGIMTHPQEITVRYSVRIFQFASNKRMLLDGMF